MSFGMVSGVGGEMGHGCIRWGSMCHKLKGYFGIVLPIDLNGQNSVFLAHKCIRLVREKLTVFPYAQYIIGIYVSLAFQRFSQVRDRCWVCEKFAKM